MRFLRLLFLILFLVPSLQNEHKMEFIKQWLMDIETGTAVIVNSPFVNQTFSVLNTVFVFRRPFRSIPRVEGGFHSIADKSKCDYYDVSISYENITLISFNVSYQHSRGSSPKVYAEMVKTTYFIYKIPTLLSYYNYLFFKSAGTNELAENQTISFNRSLYQKTEVICATRMIRHFNRTLDSSFSYSCQLVSDSVITFYVKMNSFSSYLDPIHNVYSYIGFITFIFVKSNLQDLDWSITIVNSDNYRYPNTLPKLSQEVNCQTFAFIGNYTTSEFNRLGYAPTNHNSNIRWQQPQFVSFVYGTFRYPNCLLPNLSLQLFRSSFLTQSFFLNINGLAEANINPNQISPTNFSFSNDALKILKIQIKFNKLKVEIPIHESLHGTLLTVNLTLNCAGHSVVATISPSMDNIWMTTTYQPYVYTLHSAFKWIVIVLQYFYLLLFALCISCAKMIGVETIFVIQATFYSLISTGPVNPTWQSLTSMQYVSGVNPLFSNLPQGQISNNFTILGIYSNFLSNVNIMIYILVFCPVFSKIFSTIAISYQKSDWVIEARLLRYSKACMRELPFSLVLFSCFNIYISFVVNCVTLKWGYPISIVSGVIIILMPITSGVLFFFYRQGFVQFQQQLNQTTKIGSIQIQTSTTICKMYPLVILFQFVTIPIFLAIQQLFQYNLFIVTGIVGGGFLYILFATPYKTKSNNVRLIVTRIITLGILSLILFYKLTQSKQTQVKTIYLLIPLGIIVLLIFNLVLNFVFFVKKANQQLRKQQKLDIHNITIRQNLMSPPILKKFPKDGKGKTYPIFQYSVTLKAMRQEEMMKEQKEKQARKQTIMKQLKQMRHEQK